MLKEFIIKTSAIIEQVVFFIKFFLDSKNEKKS